MNLKKILPRNVRGKIMDSLAFLPDELYIRLFFFAVTGRFLHLKHPKTFEDKQQWLKLHDQHPEYRELADKYRVREHVDEILGEGYCIPLLGVWESFDDIDFSQLPNQFVLKCNHDSGSTRVIKDRRLLTEKDYQELKRHFNERLKKDFFYAGREYPYKGIPPRILAEKYMTDEIQEKTGIDDYKFYCFNGVPKIVLIVTDRANGCHYDFFDMDFRRLDLKYGTPSAEGRIVKPPFFEDMKKVAAKLSTGIKFVRLDMYAIGGKPYFGEYTFFDGGGFQYLSPEEWEYRLGSWIDLEF